MKKVGIIVGSIRKGSLSGMVANNLKALFPADVEVKVIEIANLPLYNQDFDMEATQPKQFTEFRNAIKEVDGVLFVTPEHNRSIPAALKNALDAGSRPWGQSVWGNKAALVVSHSVGKLSGVAAALHLKQILGFLNMNVVGQPEGYLAESHTLFNEKGELANKDTVGFFQMLVNALVAKL